MACTVLRIDAEDLNIVNGINWMGTGTPVYDEAASRIYFVYTCVSAADGGAYGDNHSKSIYFRAFNTETETWVSAPVRVTGVTTDTTISNIAQCDSVGMVRTSTGRFYVIYGDILCATERHSDDNGVTWSAETNITTAFSFQQYLAAAVAPNDDVYVWTHHPGGGAGEKDTYLQKRDHTTGIWTTVGLFDDGTVSVGISADTWLNQAESIIMDTDSLRGLAVFSRLDVGAPNTLELRAYRTTDAWVTVNYTDVKVWNPYNSPTHPILRQGIANPNRFYLMWIEAPSGFNLPYFAYSDDWGVSWTVLGTPAVMAGYDWDEAFDRALFIDYADRLYSSVMGTTGTNNKHTAWINPTPTDLTAWTADDCTLDALTVWTGAGSTPGYAWYAVRADNSTRFYRAFTEALNPLGATNRSYNLLIKTDFVPPPPPPPPEPGPEDTTTRMFRRGVIQAEKRTFHNSRRAPGSFHTWRKLPRGSQN